MQCAHLIEMALFLHTPHEHHQSSQSRPPKKNNYNQNSQQKEQLEVERKIHFKKRLLVQAFSLIHRSNHATNPCKKMRRITNSHTRTKSCEKIKFPCLE